MSFIQEIDSSLHAFFIGITQSREWLYDFMRVLTHLMSPESILLFGAVVSLYFLYRRRLKDFSILAISLGGAVSIGLLTKLLFMRIRPEQSLILETGYSFPSNHAIASTALAVLLVYFLVSKINSKFFRKVFILGVSLITILSSLTRVYLGVHWFSDVIAGMVIALVWVVFVIRFVNKIWNKHSF